MVIGTFGITNQSIVTMGGNPISQYHDHAREFVHRNEILWWPFQNV